MDLVQTLASRLGVPPEAAKAVAGALLGTADDELPAAETETLEGALPELDSWRASAQETLPDGADLEQADGLFGSLGQLAGSGEGLMGALAGHEKGIAMAGVALLAKLGLESSQAQTLISSVTDFLNERIGKEWSRRVLTAAPVLIVLVAMVAKNRGYDIGEMLKGLIEHDPEEDPA